MNRDKKGRFIKGYKHSDKQKEKISKSKTGVKSKSNTKFIKGHIPWNISKTGEESLIFGDKNPNWKGGITEKDKLERMSSKYKNWRKSVFERDDYTCQECDIRGVYLEAHHIKSWSEYPELRYELDNGKALCIDCHSLTDNYKGRNNGKRY